MNVKQFLDLKVDPEAGTAGFTAHARNCVALGFLYGGAGLASSIEAMETICGRPLVWASCQFNNFAKVDDEISILVDESVRGRNVSHANLSAEVNGSPVFKALGSFGQRDIETETQWPGMPELDEPDDCPSFGVGRVKEGVDCVDNRIDIRVARSVLRKDKKTPGQLAYWVRIPELNEVSASSIALMADYLPVSAGAMLGRPAGGNSLDNSLRILKVEQSEWLLCDCEIRGIQNGFGHATANIWTREGTLLAVASQSFIFREFSARK